MIELTEHRVRGKFAGWKKYVFRRLFHLGRDHARAAAIAERLVAQGVELREIGGVWTDLVVANCCMLPTEERPSCTGTLHLPLPQSPRLPEPAAPITCRLRPRRTTYNNTYI